MKNNKVILRSFVSLLFLAVLLVSCSEQDSVFKSSQRVAYLSDLVISGSTITFDPQIKNYSVEVRTATHPVIAKAAEGSTVTITYGGTSVASSVLSGFSVASNQITIPGTDALLTNVIVTVARIGYTAQTYNVALSYIPTAKEARLTSLTSPDGSLYPENNLFPGFVPDKLKYTMNYSAPAAENAIDIVPTAYFPGSQTITVNGGAATSGSTVNITGLLVGKNTNRIKVVSSDGSMTNDYELVVNYQKMLYSTSPQGFDGGIQGFVSELLSKTGTSLGGTGNGATLTTNTTLTGVVTATDVYMHSSGDKSFFIQDQNAGFCFFTSSPPAGIKVGDKISIVVTQAKVYYGMPEAIAFGTVNILSSDNHVHYETGNYATTSAIAKVYMYQGSVAAKGDHNVGTFDDASGLLNFHWGFTLNVGDKGKFYGPVTYSYSLYRLELPDTAHFLSD